MSLVQVVFLGSGDAFGSGGRLQTCILVRTRDDHFLIDCGASALIAMRRFRVDPNAVGTILLTHLHGDHFGGLPFFILDAQLVSKRVRGLTVAGPAGTKERLLQAMEVLFPGSSTVQRQFRIDIVELELQQRRDLGGITVTPYPVNHASGAPALAFRVECEGKVIAYSGDTEWTDSLISAARDADLFIAEAYFYEKKVRYHLDYRTLIGHLQECRPKRLIITHMSEDMLTRVAALGCEYAEDGKVIDLRDPVLSPEH